MWKCGGGRDVKMWRGEGCDYVQGEYTAVGTSISLSPPTPPSLPPSLPSPPPPPSPSLHPLSDTTLMQTTPTSCHETVGDMKTPPPPDHVTRTRPLPAMTHRYTHDIRSGGSVICRGKNMPSHLTELVFFF